MTEEEQAEVEVLLAVLCSDCGSFPASESVPHGEPWFPGKFCGCPWIVEESVLTFGG